MDFVLYIAILLIIILNVKDVSFSVGMAVIALLVGIVPQAILRKTPPLKYVTFIYLGTVTICMFALERIGSNKEFQIFCIFLSVMSFAYVMWDLKKKK